MLLPNSMHTVNMYFQVRPHSLFQVEPTSGVIAPEGCIQLKVTANVNDNTR